jgi:hypothetical protein
MDASTPSREEVRQAFQCGFESIDAGDSFYQGFFGFLESLGYRKRADGRCTCPDEGAHGHWPECRWVRS